VLNPSVPTFFHLMSKKRIPARGSPNTPKIKKGRPKPNAQNI